MKIVLMVAAGIAVGMTLFLAVLIQVLERLAPVLALLALALAVLYVVRRRSSTQNRGVNQALPHAAIPPQAAPPTVAPALGSAAADHQPEPILRWGPPPNEDPDARPVNYGAGTHVQRPRAGAHPSRPGRGHRP